MYIPLIIFMLMLIFPAYTKTGATIGLKLWFDTIIPTLLPYMIVTNTINHFNAFGIVSRLLYPITSRIFGISKNANYCLITGFFCGYPMGSKVIADMLKNNRISLKEADYLLSFCNNASPSFILNYVLPVIIYHKHTGNTSLSIKIIIILFLSPILVSFIYRLVNKYKKSNSFSTCTASEPSKKVSPGIIDNCILNSFDSMFKICGYIIIFSIFSTFIQNISIFSNNISFLLSSFLEITSGLSILKYGDFSFRTAIILVLCSVSFGGLCSIAQTYSMIGETDLKISRYTIYKLINATTTLVLSGIFL